MWVWVNHIPLSSVLSVGNFKLRGNLVTNGLVLDTSTVLLSLSTLGWTKENSKRLPDSNTTWLNKWPYVQSLQTNTKTFKLCQFKKQTNKNSTTQFVLHHRTGGLWVILGEKVAAVTLPTPSNKSRNFQPPKQEVISKSITAKLLELSKNMQPIYLKLRVKFTPWHFLNNNSC